MSFFVCLDGKSKVCKNGHKAAYFFSERSDAVILKQDMETRCIGVCSYTVEESDRLPDGDEAGPLPPWASEHFQGELKRGVQLPTRDGRRFGNAVILARRFDTVDSYIIITDAMNVMTFTSNEIFEGFHTPQYVMSEEDLTKYETDYHLLILKYLNYVTDLNGTSFLSSVKAPEEHFTKDEWNKVRILDKEASFNWDEGKQEYNYE